jgi:hypothetical protein
MSQVLCFPVCEREINTWSSATFQSPNYPYTYTGSKECSYILGVTTSYLVRLEFDHFNLGDSSQCEGTYIEVSRDIEITSVESAVRSVLKFPNHGDLLSLRRSLRQENSPTKWSPWIAVKHGRMLALFDPVIGLVELWRHLIEAMKPS